MKRLILSGLSVLILLLFSFSAIAEQTAIGKVQTFRGTAVAVDAGQKRLLSTGDDLFRSETVATGAESFLQIMFLDGTVLTLDAHTQMVLNDVAYRPGDSENRNFDIEMVAGTCRFVTGQITKHNPDKFKIGSPLGSIGIRGTEGGIAARASNAQAFGAGLDAAMASPGSGWNPGAAPEVDQETVAHINGSIRRSMSFTDTFGNVVSIARGMALDVSASTGAGEPRGIDASDRESFSAAGFNTSASVPSAFSSQFSGYDASPGSGSEVSGGSEGGGGDSGGGDGGHP
ncbi:MAG: FecR domain-containing protein [Desulfovibrio sp.]